MNQTGLIIIISVIAIAIIGIVITMAYSSFSNAQNHIIFCKNWSTNLDKQRSNVISDSEIIAFNKEISDYNKQCVY